MGYDPQIGDLVANNIDYDHVVLGMITYFDNNTYKVEWYDKELAKHVGYYSYYSLRAMRELFLSVKKDCE
jgi:hypothetical protein